MRIESGAVEFAARHQSVSRREREESVRVWVTPEARAPAGDTVSISPQAEARLQELAAAAEEPGEDIEDAKLLLLKLVVERLTGVKVRVTRVECPQAQGVERAPLTQAPTSGVGFEYRVRETVSEVEATDFRAWGTIETADGDRIQFELELSMRREFFAQSETRLRMGAAPEARDPLVINFSGNAAQLVGDWFEFDLEGNGDGGRIQFVSPNSGLLALDRNGDGVINDGKELFGPRTGNGFGELAGYDADGNGWIDEADPVYGQLRIWVRDHRGQDQLFRLADKGIAAIYLDSVNTPFQLRGDQNEALGRIRSTGIYLGQDRGVDTIQQIDLVVR